MHALHNNFYIRLTIPPALLQLPDLGPDRVALRNEAATSLRDQKLQKKITRESQARKAVEDARHPQVARMDVLEVVLDDALAPQGAADDLNELDNQVAEGLFTSSQPPPPRGPRQRNPAKSKGGRHIDLPTTTIGPSSAASTVASTVATSAGRETDSEQSSNRRKRQRASTKATEIQGE